MMRTILRWAHLLVGFLIGAFVYTPARDSEAYVLLMQAAVVPAVTLTGVAGPHPPPVPPPPELRAPQEKRVQDAGGNARRRGRL
jgi:hypothetical protein